jgi:hypothetical protein
LALDCEPGPGGFIFIWKPAQSDCLPTQPPHSYALPLYLTVGKMRFRQTGQSKAGGTPAMSRAWSLRMGFLGSGWIPTDFAGKRAPGAGWVALFFATVRPGKCAPPLQAAPLGPRCLMVKDARYRPAHGCVVRGVVPLRGPPVEFTRSGAWGVCFWGFSREIGSERSRICLSFGVLAYCIQEVGACGRVVRWLVH